MTPIKDGTKDIEVQLIFNNAGFITAGMFHKVPWMCNPAAAAVLLGPIMLGVPVACSLPPLLVPSDGACTTSPSPRHRS